MGVGQFETGRYWAGLGEPEKKKLYHRSRSQKNGKRNLVHGDPR